MVVMIFFKKHSPLLSLTLYLLFSTSFFSNDANAAQCERKFANDRSFYECDGVAVTQRVGAITNRRVTGIDDFRVLEDRVIWRHIERSSIGSPTQTSRSQYFTNTFSGDSLTSFTQQTLNNSRNRQILSEVQTDGSRAVWRFSAESIGSCGVACTSQAAYYYICLGDQSFPSRPITQIQNRGLGRQERLSNFVFDFELSSATWTFFNGVSTNNHQKDLDPCVAPSSPAFVEATVNGQTVNISWDNVTEATHYDREVSINGASWQNRRTYDQPQTSAVFTNQQPREYQYRVRACNDIGCSDWTASGRVSVQATIPTAPSSVNASVSNSDDITISWSNVSIATHYEREVRINGGGWQNNRRYNQPQTSVTFTNQQPRSYQYRVRACNAAGCSGWTFSGQVTVQATLPSPPSSVGAVINNGDDITISWSNVSIATHYEREVSINGGAWQNNRTYNQPQTSVTFFNQQSRSYRYRVRACNTAGCSGWRTSGSVTVN